MKLTHEANRCHKPAMTGNGFYMPPIKMMIGGMVYDIILPTLFGMIMTNKWLVNGIVYYWVYHSKWDVDQQWMLATFVFFGSCFSRCHLMPGAALVVNRRK